jgi:hypothetical protein
VKTAFIIALANFLCAFTAIAQVNSGPKVRGTFCVSVDDESKLFVNGTELCENELDHDGQSPELELKTGDRIVVQLVNKGGPKHFFLAFLSSDQKTVISFRHTNFRIIPELNITDFKPDQMASWQKYAKEEKGKHKKPFPFKTPRKWCGATRISAFSPARLRARCCKATADRSETGFSPANAPPAPQSKSGAVGPPTAGTPH